MESIDWRRPDTYENLRDLDAAGLAFEFLRRNRDYQRTLRALRDTGTPFSQDLATALRPWGLSFPGRSHPFSARASRLLVPLGNSRRRPACPCRS